MKKKAVLATLCLLFGVFAYLIYKRSPLSPTHNIISLSKATFSVSEKISATVAAPADKVQASVVGIKGDAVDARITENEKNGSTLLTVEPPISFQPGKYTLTVESEGKTYKQDFSWGVLAINSNKSIYAPNEKATLSLAVLDEKGMMVCDAKVTLKISTPIKTTDELSTGNGKIKVNKECHVKDLVTVPDYETEYLFQNAGTYKLSLTAVTKNGSYTIDDSINVTRDTVPFDVERDSATRIYPIHEYPVEMTITANQDFTGEIVERVPYSFKINNLKNPSLPFARISFNKNTTQNYRYQEIIWDAKLKKGQTVTIGYTYDAPDKSPYFFLTGPLKFTDTSGETIFVEKRSWQIAVDDVASTLQQQVNIIDQEYSSTSQTAAPTDNSLGLVKYDGSKYNDESVYFEADIKKDDSDMSNGEIGYYPQVKCPTATDCKVAYIDDTLSSIRFKDCDDATCSTGVITILDGDTGCVITNCQPTEDMASITEPSITMYCVSTTDCKIAYVNYTEQALYFLDCDDAQCSTGTTTLIDGGSGCVLTGCSTTNWVGGYSSIDCSTGATDCKISYRDSNPSSAAVFADCDTATCSSGTRTLLDGYNSCVISGCSTSIDTRETAIDCNGSSTDCKVAYYDDTNDDLIFLDCGNSACTSATRTVVDGGTGCGLTNCATSAARGDGMSMDCVSATDCKIVYAIGIAADLVFADCDTATCSTGTVTTIDGTTGCTLTGCSTSVAAGDRTSIDCSNGATDCKIGYNRSTTDLYLADCDTATCSTGTTTLLDGASSCTLTGCANKALHLAYYGVTIDCTSGTTDCKIAYSDNNIHDVYFADCASATCSSGTTISIDGSGGGNQKLGDFIAMTCLSADDCKIVYHEEVGSTSNDQLRFMDCDDATCSTGTMSVIDGAGCIITNCSDGTGSWNNIGEHTSISCVTTDDCKIVYTNYAADLFFIDCDDTACSSGTRTMPDGASGCTLTGCSTSAWIDDSTSLDCIATDDCKIAYSVGSSSHDIYFADCDTATCSTGTRTLLNGGTSCVLTGCNTGLQANTSLGMDCVTASDCKISHFDDTGDDLWFLDCDSATCASGTASMIDGGASCPLTGCSTSATNTGLYNSIDCIGGSNDCKIAYYRNSDTYFADCDNATCTSGTTTLVDGSTGCVITGCINSPYNLGMYVSLDCVNGATDCKIAMYSNQSDLSFVDCDNAACSSGSRNYIDGTSGCTLTNCSTSTDQGKFASLDCIGGSADCKIAYQYYEVTEPTDVMFADCSSSSCSTGSTLAADDGNERIWVELYDSSGNKVKNSTLMATSENYARVRAAVPLTLVDDTNYTVRIRSSDSTTTAYIKAARLIIPQNGSSVTDTQTQIEIGNNETTTGTSYAALSAPKILNYNPAKYSDEPDVYFEATIKNSASNTTSVILATDSTCSSTIASSEITTTGTTWTLVRTASSIADDLSSSNYYVCVKTSTGTASIANAKLVIDQSNPSGIGYLQLYHTLANTVVTDTDTTYTSQDYLNAFSTSNYTGGYTTEAYYEATMKTSAGTGNTRLINATDDTTLSGASVSTTGTSYTRVRSDNIWSALPSSSKDLDTQMNNSSTNTTSVANAWLIIEFVPPPPLIEGQNFQFDGIQFD